MPRPSEMDLLGSRAPGFAPTDPSNITTQVVAPLDVQAAPDVAHQLAVALGHAQPMVESGLREDAMAAGMKDAEKEHANEQQGSTDAYLGQIDPEKAKTVVGYGEGAHRASVEMNTITALNDLRSKVATEWLDKPLHDYTAADGTSQPGIMSMADDFLRSRLGGLDTDPNAAKIMGPMVQHAMNEIAGAKNHQEIVHTQQLAEDTASGLLLNDIQHGTNSFVVNDQLTKLSQVYGGDMHAARSALVHAVGEAAVTGGDPSVITKYLPNGVDFGNGATLTPENQQYLDNARARATEAQQRNNQAVVRQSEDNIASAMLQNKDPTEMLHAYLQLPGAHAETALSMYDWYYRRGKQREQDSVDNNQNTWDMDRAIAGGDITNGGDLLKWLSDRGVGNTKAGNMMFQRGMNNIRTFQNTSGDDPDYRALYTSLDQKYKPGVNPMTGKFLNDSANSQHAGVLLDFRAEYNQYQKGGMSSPEAARKAAAQVEGKYGTPVEDPSNRTGGNWQAPKDDISQAQIVRDAWKDPSALARSAISAKDLVRLRDTGMISSADADRTAAQLLQLRHPNH